MDAGVRGQQLNPFKHELHESALNGAQTQKNENKTTLKLKMAEIAPCFRHITLTQVLVFSSSHVCRSVWSADPMRAPRPHFQRNILPRVLLICRI